MSNDSQITTEEFEALRIFRSVDRTVLRELFSAVRHHGPRKDGDLIYDKGDRAEEIYFLNACSSEGPSMVEMEIPSNGPGNPVKFEPISGGEVFGEIEFGITGLSGASSRRITRASCVTDIRVFCSVSYAALAIAVAQSEVLRKRLVEKVVKRLLDRLSSQAAESRADPEATLLGKFVAFAQNKGHSFGNIVRFDRRMTQTTVGEILGLKREQMNFWLGEWERSGLVDAVPLAILDFRQLDLIAASIPRTSLPLEHALAQLLLRECEEAPSTKSERIRLPASLTTEEIANRLAATLGAVDSAIATLRQHQVVAAESVGRNLEISDLSALLFVANSESFQDRMTLYDILTEIDSEISRGNLVRSRNIGYDALKRFSSSPELRHRVALSCARSRSLAEALNILSRGELLLSEQQNFAALRRRIVSGLMEPRAPSRQMPIDRDEDDDDPLARPRFLVKLANRLLEDICSLAGKIEKEHAFSCLDGKRIQHALRSADLYERTFDATKGYYSGINAATMFLIAGNHSQAERLARKVLSIIPDGQEDYWATATKGEACLLLGQDKAAIDNLAIASRSAHPDDGQMASTRLQMVRLCTAARKDYSPFLETLPVGRVAVYSGHIFRGAEMSAEDQSQLEKILTTKVDHLLAAQNVRYLFGALACGADIIFAEAAIAAKNELHVILPLSIPDFEKHSINLGNPPGNKNAWNKRYERCLEKATSVEIVKPFITLDRDLDEAFYYGFRYAAGAALLKADQLVSECHLFAVVGDTQVRNIAGAAQTVADWTARRRPIHTIEFPLPRRNVPGLPRAARSFRPVLFLSEMKLSSATAETWKERIWNALPNIHVVDRKARDGRIGYAIVLSSMQDARAAIMLLQGAEETVRIIADFGPVLDGAEAISSTLVTRLRGASDLKGFPNCTLATSAFAMEARYALEGPIELIPIGRFITHDETAEAAADPSGKFRAANGIFRVLFNETDSNLTSG